MKRTFYLIAIFFLAHFISTNMVEGSINNEPNSVYQRFPDFDNNGIVNFNDFAFLADNWLWQGQMGENKADLDFSGSVDFNDLKIFSSQWLYQKDSVAIIIDTNTYLSLPGEIERLKNDIENDLGVNVYIIPDNWVDIKSIKKELEEKYNNNHLIGAIFIGDIPTAYFEYQNSGYMPSDWYFQDFSDNFFDTDSDGKFEREYYLNETDITMRDIWTGRIKPPLGRSEGIELIRNYLDRNHKYRTGNFEYTKKMLYYGSVAINQNGISEYDYFNLMDEIHDYMNLYESVNDINAIYDTSLETQKQIYLSQLPNSYDFAFINIHGSPISQWLGNSSYVYYDEIKTKQPGALFSVLASCSNGDFTQENYFAGWYLFSGNSLVVMGNTIPTMLVGADSAEFLKDYIPLGLGVNFGQMYQNDRSFMVNHILGDPTLTMRKKPQGDLPYMVIDKTCLNFSDTIRGTKSTKFVSFENSGTSTLKVQFVKARYSINNRWEQLGYWDIFYFKHPETGSTFRDFEVGAGQTKNIQFVFYPRADGPDGKYSMTMLFQTNDPEMPYLEIKLLGKAI